MKYLTSLALRHTSSFTDYIVLMKPELTLLSVSTAVGSAYIALQGSAHYVLLVHTLIGTILIGGTAGTLNQYFERRYDAMMKRTERRPLPAGRIQPVDALIFAVVIGIAGVTYLALLTNWVAVTLSIITLVSYLALYTPLKRVTPFATVVGGIPGALPPLIGWAVVQGKLPLEAWSLFLILFFWQMPHFLSLAWMFRNDYARAGFRLLTVLDADGTATRLQILVYALALIPASLMPVFVGMTNTTYLICALFLNLGFLSAAIYFYRARTNAAAHTLFYTSICFLPALFLLLMVL
ncbi:MAG: protoheme IX farnesyltransferase [Ignavibacteriae bacterium]|nr:MAG: protoheme IX farnesyltransferase [Ignavibacteriota bacterium]